MFQEQRRVDVRITERSRHVRLEVLTEHLRGDRKRCRRLTSRNGYRRRQAKQIVRIVNAKINDLPACRSGISNGYSSCS